MNSIQEIIDAELFEESQKERTSSGKWKPSLFGRCYRLQYWSRKGIPPTNLPDPRTLRVFKCGNLFHSFVQDTVIKRYKEVEKEVLCETDDIRGYADLIGDGEVVDVKSVHSKFFHYTKKSKDILGEHKNQVLQTSWYAIEKNLKKGRLCWVSKDDLCIEEVGWDITDKIKHELNDVELFELRNFWEKEELPPPCPRAYNGKECGYCQYLDLCVKIQHENGEKHPTDKEKK